MNEVEKLLKEPCPNGVEYKPLGSISSIQAGSGFPRQYQGKSEGIPFLKVSDMNHPANQSEMHRAANYVTTEDLTVLKAKVAPAGTVIFPKIGAAIATNKKRILTVESAYDNNVFGVIPDSSLNPRFLLYWLQTVNLSTIASDSGAVPSIRKTDVAKLLVATPPLVVQDKIVEILDTFTELEAELVARRKQYEHYRDALLNFPSEGGKQLSWEILGSLFVVAASVRSIFTHWACQLCTTVRSTQSMVSLPTQLSLTLTPSLLATGRRPSLETSSSRPLRKT
ncbi:restriction endonuclease subunit S [Corynebacterium argentoratense]|uniref:restriction endonuclease subunit S n=1 Tax=Corynebacterium argentoratense TaxID=42817 RepID=UPI00248D8641|nr:restriction endonuclease subunit S [Corynebacterium argentoratense]